MKTLKLYEIDWAIMKCIDQETGEIVDPERLDALQMEREKKMEGVACWIKNLESDAEALKVEKTALAEREAKARKKADSLRVWLANALQGQKMATPRCEVSFRKSEAVEFDNEEWFIHECSKHDTDGFLLHAKPKANRTAIKTAIKNGQEIPGVKLVERMNMSIK